MTVDQDVFVLVPNPGMLGVVDIVPFVEFLAALSEHDTLTEALDDASIDVAFSEPEVRRAIERVRAFNATGDLYAFHGLTPPGDQAEDAEGTDLDERAESSERKQERAEGDESVICERAETTERTESDERAATEEGTGVDER